jgi:GntR family transcriptional repressor for pyruvate dehydrogenase complex
MLRNQSQKEYELVMNYVHHKILDGEYRLGDCLPPEQELADQLSISSDSVLEGYRILNIMGLLDYQANSGNYIAGNFEKNLRISLSMMFVLQNLDYPQISQFRACMESKALELACENRSASHLKELRSIVREMRSCADIETSARLDAKFHYTIAMISQNKFIIDILQALSSLTANFIHDTRGYILSQGTYKEALQLSHEQIVQGIEQQDFSLAERALKEHFRIVDVSLLSMPSGK